MQKEKLMKDSIQKYFQVGTIQWMSHPPISYDLLDSIKSIASDEYFSAVEVTSIMDEETRKKVKHLLEQSHLKVCFGAQPSLLGPGLNPNDVDEDRRKQAERSLSRLWMRPNIWGQVGLRFWQVNGKRTPKL